MIVLSRPRETKFCTTDQESLLELYNTSFESQYHSFILTQN